ncbi:hypothetical protein WG66_004274 [Moniliophthora roreri]|uniref:Uncharacterized protein n=1 Tax=Moniliophthora roreri TaxID=221103 RepID=A0A0W0EU09_MONRR|nr:hypothetical protein WG66_004274 [Moniliophthora roreri]
MFQVSLASLLVLTTRLVHVYPFRFAPVPSTVTPGIPITVTWFRSAQETESFVIVKNGGGRLGSIATITVDAKPGQTSGTAEVTFFETKKFILQAVQTNALGDPINTIFFDSQTIRNFGERDGATQVASEMLSGRPAQRTGIPVTTTTPDSSSTITSENGIISPSGFGSNATMTSTTFGSGRQVQELSPGAIVGIVIGCCAFILTCVWIFRYRLNRRRIRMQKVTTPELDVYMIPSNLQPPARSKRSVSQRHRDAGPVEAVLHRSGSGELPPAYQDLV